MSGNDQKPNVFWDEFLSSLGGTLPKVLLGIIFLAIIVFVILPAFGFNITEINFGPIVAVPYTLTPTEVTPQPEDSSPTPSQTIPPDTDTLTPTITQSPSATLTRTITETPENFVCVPFREYTPGHDFGNPWTHPSTNFLFTSENQLIVDQINFINGLFIEDTYLRVEIPGVHEHITIQAVVGGNSPATIIGLGPVKNQVAETTIPNTSQLSIAHLDADEISVVIFSSSGDYQAALVEICTGDLYR